MRWADHSFFYLIFFSDHLYPPCCRLAGQLSLQDWLPETAPLWLKGRQWERGSPHSNAAGVFTRPIHPAGPWGPGQLDNGGQQKILDQNFLICRVDSWNTIRHLTVTGVVYLLLIQLNIKSVWMQSEQSNAESTYRSPLRTALFK